MLKGDSMTEPERYMHHVTLTTGRSRKIARSEVKENTLNELRSMLTEALAERGKVVAIPRIPECVITATPIRRALLATI